MTMMSTSPTILEVDRIYKRYARSNAAARKQLSSIFLNTLVGRSGQRDAHRDEEFWGLRNISFQVDQGAALGIIGFNGAGKTSLLRVLNGQLMPDRGEVRILGSSASFIDLGAGFNMAMSGRENIFIKGAILGRSREEMDAISEDIITFAELGDFINSPVKNYSSGMMARLGFSLVTHVDPRLLLIDEILAVGDFHFRQKCLQRVREMRERSSFVLVSHNMRDIRNFCDEVIVLEQGAVAFKGIPADAIAFYEESEARLSGANQPEASSRLQVSVHGHLIKREDQLELDHAYWGTPNGDRLDSFAIGDPVGVHFRFRVKFSPRGLRIGIPIWNDENVLVTAFASYQGDRVAIPDEEGICEGFLDLTGASLNPGDHLAILSIHDGPEFLLRQPLEVVEVKNVGNTQYWGTTHMPHKWTGLTLK